MTHEVSVLCNCPDVEHCQMERYIADVRTAYAEIQRLNRWMDLAMAAAEQVDELVAQHA